jgi:hypothetical protein
MEKLTHDAVKRLKEIRRNGIHGEKHIKLRRDENIKVYIQAKGSVELNLKTKGSGIYLSDATSTTIKAFMIEQELKDWGSITQYDEIEVHNIIEIDRMAVISNRLHILGFKNIGAVTRRNLDEKIEAYTANIPLLSIKTIENQETQEELERFKGELNEEQEKMIRVTLLESLSKRYKFDPELQRYADYYLTEAKKTEKKVNPQPNELEEEKFTQGDEYKEEWLTDIDQLNFNDEKFKFMFTGRIVARQKYVQRASSNVENLRSFIMEDRNEQRIIVNFYSPNYADSNFARIDSLGSIATVYNCRLINGDLRYQATNTTLEIYCNARDMQSRIQLELDVQPTKISPNNYYAVNDTYQPNEQEYGLNLVARCMRKYDNSKTRDRDKYILTNYQMQTRSIQNSPFIVSIFNEFDKKLKLDPIEEGGLYKMFQMKTYLVIYKN